MAGTESVSRRPICQSCSKPARVCLCARFRTTGLDNSVSVTILQHSLETKHPLNSTRIAKLGFKNLNVVTVSDVLYKARNEIRLLDHEIEAVPRRNGLESSVLDPIQIVGFEGGDELSSKRVKVANFVLERDINCLEEGNTAIFDEINEKNSNHSYPAISATIGKDDALSEIFDVWIPGTQSEVKIFDQILASEEVMEALAKGFVVKKFQSEKPTLCSEEAKEHKEFELEVPPGSVLLFPSEKAVDANDLKAMEFEVKNLIVLDGTWRKARRMYCENPWLQMLPHLRLDVEKMSLYGEVRQQPKVGYLSTIESIVYALKALGNNLEGLDNLLDVFESMVGDQRRCHIERMSKVSIAIE